MLLCNLVICYEALANLYAVFNEFLTRKNMLIFINISICNLLLRAHSSQPYMTKTVKTQQSLGFDPQIPGPVKGP